MAMSLRIYLLLLLGTFCVSAHQFAIMPDGKNCRIMLDNELMVDKVSSGLDWDKSYSIESSNDTLQDTSRVYNVWSSDSRLDFRMEIDVSSDASQVEITTKTERQAYFPYSQSPRQLTIHIPPEFLGESCSFAGYTGDGRSVRKLEGTVDATNDMPQKQWRFFCLKTSKHEMLFDCQPIGPGEWCGLYGSGIIRGTAIIEGNTAKGISISFPNGIESFGGMTAAKLRIKIGNMSDYSKDHAITAWMVSSHLSCSAIKTIFHTHTSSSHPLWKCHCPNMERKQPPR